MTFPSLISRLPVGLQSFLIQLVALLLVVAGARWAQVRFHTSFELDLLVLAQAGLAVGLSWAWRQPRWWLMLHGGFLPAVWGANQLGLPPAVYLAGFVLLALFFWTTFRNRVPLYLSDRKAWDAVAAQLPADRPFRFIDLGSGLGGLLFDLERRFPQATFTGTELAPAPWLLSQLRATLRRSRVRFLRRDYAALDLADYDVVFAFLSPAAMPALWQQVCAQMRPGSCFMSLSFTAGERAPDTVIQLATQARHRLYVWRL